MLGLQLKRDQAGFAEHVGCVFAVLAKIQLAGNPLVVDLVDCHGFNLASDVSTDASGIHSARSEPRVRAVLSLLLLIQDQVLLECVL